MPAPPAPAPSAIALPAWTATVDTEPEEPQPLATPAWPHGVPDLPVVGSEVFGWDNCDAVSVKDLVPCPQCGSLQFTEDFDGNRRCQPCNSGRLQFSLRTARKAARLQQKADRQQARKEAASGQSTD